MIVNVFLFQYVQNNKESDNDWFRLESNTEGTRWFGKCWYIHELLKYEFDVEFDVSNTVSLYICVVAVTLRRPKDALGNGLTVFILSHCLVDDQWSKFQEMLYFSL